MRFAGIAARRIIQLVLENPHLIRPSMTYGDTASAR